MNILERIEQRPRGRSEPISEDKGGASGWSRGMEGSVTEGAEQEARWGACVGPGGHCRTLAFTLGEVRAWEGLEQIATLSDLCSERDTRAAV